MNILILGAAGATGRLCVDECLARGHKVGAFVHNSALRNAGERLEDGARRPQKPSRHSNCA